MGLQGTVRLPGSDRVAAVAETPPAREAGAPRHEWLRSNSRTRAEPCGVRGDRLRRVANRRRWARRARDDARARSHTRCSRASTENHAAVPPSCDRRRLRLDLKAHASATARSRTTSSQCSQRPLCTRTESRYAFWTSSVTGPTPIWWSSTERAGRRRLGGGVGHEALVCEVEIRADHVRLLDHVAEVPRDPTGAFEIGTQTTVRTRRCRSARSVRRTPTGVMRSPHGRGSGHGAVSPIR